jgi:hypothetical protein
VGNRLIFSHSLKFLSFPVEEKVVDLRKRPVHERLGIGRRNVESKKYEKTGKSRWGGVQLRPMVAVWLVLQISIGSAASPAIGVASAKGSFDLDASKTAGNGTLFEGSTVETGKATSELKMANGVRMTLDSGTRGKVFRNHLLLEKGTGQIESGTYTIMARALQIQPSPSGQAKVTLKGGNRVLVAALNSRVRITNTSGLLIAELAPGRALELEPQEAGAAPPSTLTGCLVKKAGHYLLTDETAGITVELQGSGLEKEVGNRIEVMGVTDPTATAVESASQVIRASRVKQLGKRCTASAAKGAAAGAGAAGAGAGAAGAGAGAGAAGAAGAGAAGAATAAGAAGAAAAISTTTAVVAGVAVASAAAGVAVGVTREEKADISQ